MKKLYKYVYNMEKGANPICYVEEYLVKDDEDYPNKEEMTSWERDYYNFVDRDNGIDKTAVDNWNAIGYQDKPSGKNFWSFKNDRETMMKFQNIIKEQETDNLIHFLESVDRIKERIKAIKEMISEGTSE